MERFPVFICNDVSGAHEAGNLERDTNSLDREFSAQVQSMIIARVEVQVPAADTRMMIALLYVTSRKRIILRQNMSI